MEFTDLTPASEDEGGLRPLSPMALDSAICYRALTARDARFDGRFFVGVTSTGIYCRPICPAPSAKFAHCRFYPTAAAAQEAGFRPCLRCRPETAPFSPAWNGSRTTVARALRLIERGALDQDGASVEMLATRVGVGARHLSRLFLRHLGASPVQLARTLRVQRAKRLLDDTELSMTEVAARAGFGSLRRFNAVFAETYRRPPTAIRRARSPAGSSKA